MKIKIDNYSFDKTARTVTFTDYATINLNSVLLITNATSNIIIYNFSNPLKGGTAATNVLTLTYDTSAMSNTDKLQIYYDDANNDQGLKIDTAASTDTGTFSIYAFWKRLMSKFTTQLPAALGQTTMSASLPVTLASNQSALPLPTGASTEATLALIKAKTDNIQAPGQALAAASSPVVLPAAQITTLTPPAAITGFSTEATLASLLAKIIASPATEATLASVLAKIITAPATEAKQDTLIAKDFATQTTLASVLAKIIAAPATEATLALIKAKTDNIDVALSTRTKPADAQHTIIDSGALPTGASTETTLGTRLSESDFDTKAGSLTETAPASDTASSGLNGRLQRLAQRLTSLIALLPTAIGQSVMSNSFRVAIASDQSKVPVANGELTLTGGGSQTALNQNIINVSSGTGSIDATGYGLFSIQINTASGTVTAGVITFEGSNDDTNFVPISVIDVANNTNVSTYTVLASTQKFFIGQIAFKYVRARISTAITGTTTGVQAITRFSALYSSNGLIGIGSALPAGANAIGKLAANSGVVIGDVNVVNSNVSQNVSQINGVTPLMGNGATGTGSPRVTIANDNTDIPVKLQPQTSGGLTTFHLVSAASTNATVVKASAGQLFGWYIYNNNAAIMKVAFHNTTSTPTAGASIFLSLVIPPNSGANSFTDTGIAFSTGIAITLVGGLSDANSSSVGANDLLVNLFYR